MPIIGRLASQLIAGSVTDASTLQRDINQIFWDVNTNCAPLADPVFTGTVTAQAINASGDLNIGSGKFGGTLGVTGTSTLAAINASGQLAVTVASGYATTFMGGNVGIGTTVPGSTLQLGNYADGQGGTPTYRGQLVLANSGSDTTMGGIEFWDSCSGSGYGAREYVNSNDDSYNIATRYNSAAYTRALTVKLQTSNVGIGTTTINEKLTVNGTISTVATSSTGTAVILDASNVLRPLTSGESTKTVTNASWTLPDADLDTFLSKSPIVFDYPSTHNSISGWMIHRSDDEGILGFSADDLETVNPQLVNYGLDRKPYSLREHAIMAYMFSGLKQHHARLKVLERSLWDSFKIAIGIQ